MVLHFGGIYGSKVVITEEEGGVGVRKTSTRGEGIDRWVVRRIFRGLSLSKPGKSGR